MKTLGMIGGTTWHSTVDYYRAVNELVAARLGGLHSAKLILYSAFVDGKLEAPRSLLPEVHRLYFEPEYPEFSQRTMWSLSNAFTSAFKKLDPVPQFKATAKLGSFLAQLPA